MCPLLKPALRLTDAVNAVVHIGGGDDIGHGLEPGMGVAHGDPGEGRREHVEVVGVVAEDHHVLRRPADAVEHPQQAIAFFVRLNHHIIAVKAQMTQSRMIEMGETVFLASGQGEIHFVNIADGFVVRLDCNNT